MRAATTALRHVVAIILVALACLAIPASAQFGEDEGGPPDYVAVKAFLDRDAYRPGETARILVEFKIDPRVHINSDTPKADYQVPTSLSWTTDGGLPLSGITWPKAAMKAFEFTEGEKIPVFEGTQRASFTATIPADAAPGKRAFEGVFMAQGCTHSVCYAPQTDPVTFALSIVGTSDATTAMHADRFGAEGTAATAAPAAAAPSEVAEGAPPAEAGAVPTAAEVEVATTPSAGSDDESAPPDAGAVDSTVAAGVPPPDAEPLDAQCPTGKEEELPTDRPLALVYLFTFLSGIVLAFTPCVLPLVPITIGFFARQSGGGRRPVVPALLYVLGLALVYSALGTIAALSGGLFGSMLQQPVVIIGIAAILFALALSMFGLWDFNLPSSISNRLGGGRSGPLGAMAMGGAMGLIAAPCVGPLVVSLLTYVAELGSKVPRLEAALLGGSLFFALSLGLGLPFFLVALGAGSLRPGEWMVTVKKIFGFIILGLVLYFLKPLIGAPAFEWALVLLLAVAGVYLLIHSRAPDHGPRARVAVAAVGVLSILAMVGWGWISVQHARRGPVGTHAFAEYSDDAVERAKADGRPVVIDFSAEWCIACKELEHRTFPDEAVKAKLREFVSLRSDLTDPGAENDRIYKKWGLRGLPTIVFLDSDGTEIRPLRLTGFETPENFLVRLDCATKIDIASR